MSSLNRLLRPAAALALLGLLVAGRGASAAVAATKQTIVLVSMKENSDKFWPAGENRIRDELRISNFKVLVESTATGEADDFEAELEDIAVRYEVAAAILVYNADQASVHLCICIVDAMSGAHVYRDHAFALSSTQEEADIVALKSADVVQSTLTELETSGHYTLGGEAALAQKRFKLRNRALAFFLAGVADLAVAGTLHSRMAVHEDRANRARKKSGSYEPYVSGYNADLQKWHNDNGAATTAATVYQAGALSAYAVGGVLLATGGVFLFRFLRLRGEERPTMRLYPTVGGAGLTMEF